jgi:hypothetical protein
MEEDAAGPLPGAELSAFGFAALPLKAALKAA